MSDRRYVLTGWWLFVVCAILFIISTARAGDLIGVAGSVAFLMANISFMIPLYRKSE